MGTLFPATATTLESRKRWLLSGTAESGGVVIVDDGAVTAVRAKERSLLPAGIREVRGTFQRGDVVSVQGQTGERIAYGITNYDSDDLRSIGGTRSTDIDGILGHHYGDEAIHRNNMVVL